MYDCQKEEGEGRRGGEERGGEVGVKGHAKTEHIERSNKSGGGGRERERELKQTDSS